jgi:hypothetical protein
MVAGIFSWWLIATPHAGLPRLLIVPGAAVVAISLAFIADYATYVDTDPAGRILDRAAFWSIPFLEWASLLSLLGWFVCVSIVLLRDPAG